MHMHTPHFPSGTGKRRFDVGGHALVLDGQTDRQTNIMSVERRFVLTNASRAKNSTLPRVCSSALCILYENKPTGVNRKIVVRPCDYS